ncbi:MAG: transposase [Candidatus Competibacteraceae bacterium]|nr:transposase [Candidatus Competibacteraceae bacterium]
MPRKPRFHVPGMAVHVVQRGHNRVAVFFADFDYLEYLKRLRQAAEAHGCVIHAYALMTNHIHLLLTPERKESVGLLFQAIGRHYVRYINTTYHRHGSLWEGRYKASLVDSSGYLLTCMRYIEMNPVRAGMVDHPAEYRWSSYVANASGDGNAIVTPHQEYLSLGASAIERQRAYRRLFNEAGDVDEVTMIRNALQTGTPLGNDRFKAQIETALGMKVGYSTRGRPKVVPCDADGVESRIRVTRS